MPGWIKIERNIQNNWVWEDKAYSYYWMNILLNVNYESKKFPVKNEIFTCNPGESFRSIDDWSRLFRCSKPTVLKFFKLLESDAMIQTKIIGNGNRRKHLLTVVNWKKYQQTETENFTEVKPETLPEINPIINPKLSPNKNDNKEKKEKNEIKKTSMCGSKDFLEISFDLLYYFDFDPDQHPDKKKLVDAFLNELANTNNLIIFSRQFKAYQQYKDLTHEKRHSLTSFIGSWQVHYTDGGWNSKNWEIEAEKQQAIEARRKTNGSSIMKPDYELAKQF